MAKICLPQADQAVEKLEHESGIGVALSHRDQVDILVLHMAERGRPQCEDGRADLCVGDDLDAEYVGEAWAAVVAEGAKYEVLALLVEDENAGEHVGSEERSGGRRRQRNGVLVSLCIASSL